MTQHSRCYYNFSEARTSATFSRIFFPLCFFAFLYFTRWFSLFHLFPNCFHLEKIIEVVDCSIGLFS